MSGPSLRRIWLCADDYGISPGVNRAIRDLIERGRLNATSVMVVGSSIGRDETGALQAAAATSPRCAIGLHATLTAPFHPLTMHFRPLDGGMFLPFPKLLRAGLSRRLDPEMIRAELMIQLATFTDLFGRPPDFVDGHQHAHVLAPIRRWLFDELDARALTGKIWLRDSTDRPSRILRRNTELKKAFAVSWLGRGFAREAAARGFSTNEGFSGFSGFDPCADYAVDFATYLRAPGRRHLIMCHPGYCDAELVLIDPVTLTRERELSFLLSPAFAETLERASLRLARMTPPRIEIAA